MLGAGMCSELKLQRPSGMNALDRSLSFCPSSLNTALELQDLGTASSNGKNLGRNPSLAFGWMLCTEELILGWKGWEEALRLGRTAGMGLGLSPGGSEWDWKGKDGTGTYWSGFSPVWIRRWMIKLLLVRKERAQNSQM